MATELSHEDQNDTKQEHYECICGKNLTKTNDAPHLYNSNSVYCDNCKEEGKPNDIFWHCGKNNIHRSGFDICNNKCIYKYDVSRFREERIPNLFNNIAATRILNYDTDSSNISLDQLLKNEPDDKKYIISKHDQDLLILIHFKQHVDIHLFKLHALPNSINYIKNNCDFQYKVSIPKQAHIYKIDSIKNCTFKDITSKKPAEIINIPHSSTSLNELKCVKYIAIHITSNNDTEKTYLNAIKLLSIPSQSIITSNKHNQQVFDKMKDEYSKINVKSFKSKQFYLLKPTDYSVQETSCDITKCDHLKQLIHILRRYKIFIQQKEKHDINDDEKKFNVSDTDIYYPNVEESAVSEIKTEHIAITKATNTSTISKEEVLKASKQIREDITNSVLPNLLVKVDRMNKEAMKQKKMIYAVKAQQTSNPMKYMTQFTAKMQKQVEQLKLLQKTRDEKIKEIESVSLQRSNINYSQVKLQSIIRDLYNDKYNHTDLLNDFHHLLTFHSQQFEQIYNILTHHRNL
eukprot:307991_1